MQRNASAAPRRQGGYPTQTYDVKVRFFVVIGTVNNGFVGLW